MSDNTEDHTIRLLQEMRAEMRQGFESMSTRMDGMTHILVMLAAQLHRHDGRLAKLERKAG